MMRNASTESASRRIDPVTTEVIGSTLSSIADEMFAALVKSAYSTNIKERQDCSTAIVDVNGDVAMIGEMSQPVHLGSFDNTGTAILKRFPLEKLRQGDIFVLNDVYTGGPSHLADVTFVAPIFSRDELVAFVVNTGHWPDVGGKAPGQCALGDATEIFQEGLRIPPMRLYEAGELRGEVLELIRINVRDSGDREGDIRAHVGCLRLGERRIMEIVTRYGAALTKAAIEELARAAEIRTRHRILELNAGDYEAVDYLDGDTDSAEAVRLQVRIVVRHEPEPGVLIDFSGTAPAVRWGINNPIQGTRAVVFWVARAILDPTVPPNKGFRKLIEIRAPDSSIVNPRPPSPVGARSEVMFALVDLLCCAFAPAVKDAVVEAGGHGVHGIGFSRPNPGFIYYETVAGGGGARRDQDGIDGVHSASNLPIEAMEMEFPILAERLEYVQDSGGAGRCRGGLGIRKDYRARADMFASAHSSRHVVPGPGLLGGRPGGLTTIVLRPPAGGSVPLDSQATLVPVSSGGVLSIASGGGGGYGAPTLRQPSRVLEDVLDGKISLRHARENYGVVIDPETLLVDERATANRRAHLLSRAS